MAIGSTEMMIVMQESATSEEVVDLSSLKARAHVVMYRPAIESR